MKNLEALRHTAESLTLPKEQRAPFLAYWDTLSKEADRQSVQLAKQFIPPFTAWTARGTLDKFARAYYQKAQKDILLHISRFANNGKFDLSVSSRAKMPNEAPVQGLFATYSADDIYYYFLNLRWDSAGKRPLSLSLEQQERQPYEDWKITTCDLLFLPTQPQTTADAAALLSTQELQTIHKLHLRYTPAYNGFTQRYSEPDKRDRYFNSIAIYNDPVTRSPYQVYANLVRQ